MHLFSMASIFYTVKNVEDKENTAVNFTSAECDWTPNISYLTVNSSPNKCEIGNFTFPHDTHVVHILVFQPKKRLLIIKQTREEKFISLNVIFFSFFWKLFKQVSWFVSPVLLLQNLWHGTINNPRFLDLELELQGFVQNTQKGCLLSQWAAQTGAPAVLHPDPFTPE